MCVAGKKETILKSIKILLSCVCVCERGIFFSLLLYRCLAHYYSSFFFSPKIEIESSGGEMRRKKRERERFKSNDAHRIHLDLFCCLFFRSHFCCHLKRNQLILKSKQK